ncbi:MAG: hypothetical protein JSV24_03860, partial [Bacteroidales bacterium]
CFTPESMATKLVSLYPGNVVKGKPVINGIVILNDAETGEPLAVFNGAKLTAVRTGAVGGVGVRYLSDPSINTAGIIGLGVQGFHQAIFACAVRGIQKLYVYDTDPGTIEPFKEKFSLYYPRVTVEAVSFVTDLIKKSELIVTATTSKTPVIPDDKSLFSGKKFIGFGTYKPDMREFPESLFRSLEQIFIDTGHALAETGDLIDPLKQGWIREDQVFTMGKLIMGERKIDFSGTNLFKSVGMALFDLVVSDFIYREAKEQGIGTEVEI